MQHSVPGGASRASVCHGLQRVNGTGDARRPQSPPPDAEEQRAHRLGLAAPQMTSSAAWVPAGPQGSHRGRQAGRRVAVSLPCQRLRGPPPADHFALTPPPGTITAVRG